MQVDEDKFDRQKRVSGWSQEKVSEAKCLVAGAGALGNEVIKLLLQLGVKQISLVDYDVVVKANLNRCIFFSEEDAENKEFKAIAVAREAKKINSSATVEAVLSKVEDLPEDFFKKFDFTFGCLDNLGARLHLNAHSYGHSILIDGGTSGLLGKVQAVSAPSSCIECGLSKRDYALLWKKYNCVGELIDWIDPKMPALPTTTSVVASVQVNEFIKLAHKKPSEKDAEDILVRGASAPSLGVPENSLVGKYLFYNGLKGETQVFEVPKKKNCSVH